MTIKRKLERRLAHLIVCIGIFYNTHRNKLENNQRISMMYRTWDKKSDDEKEELLTQADFYLNHIDDL